MEELYERGASKEREDDSVSYLPEVLFTQGKLGRNDDDVIQEDLTGRGATLTETDYVAISALTLSHLPLPIRSDAVLEAIKAVGARVVRVRVDRLSPGRRGTFAHVEGDLDKACSTGSGLAVFIHTLFIIVSTNRHVVFDDFEARHSTIEFFADDKKSWLQNVRFFQGYGVISAHSDHDFALVVYWLQRPGRSSVRWDPESVRCHKDLTPFRFPHLAYTHAASPSEDAAPKPGDCGVSDVTGHVSPDAAPDPNPPTGSAEASAEVTETQARKYVCVIAHPEGDTKHVSFGEILKENDVTHEVRHTAPTSHGSSGAPILIISPCEANVPPDSIWYHCGELKEAPTTKVAKLQLNTAKLFAVEFNRGLVGWKLLSDLLDKQHPDQGQPQSGEGDGVEGDASTSVAGKGEPQEKTSKPPPASDPPPDASVIASLPSGLSVACKLLTWLYAAVEAMLRHDFLGSPEISSPQPPAANPPPPSSQPPPPTPSPSSTPPPPPFDQACLVAAFQRLASLVTDLLGDESLDSRMHPISFLTLSKAVKDLHSAVHDHHPCFCRVLFARGDALVVPAGREPPTPPPSSETSSTTPLPARERPTGCLLQSTLELLAAFLADPGVTVLKSLPVLNLVFRLGTHLARVVVLQQALGKTRTHTTEGTPASKEAALEGTTQESQVAVSTAVGNDRRRDEGGAPCGGRHLDAHLGTPLLTELTAIFADCFGSFLSISDPWIQVNKDWTETKPSEVIPKDARDPSSEKLKSEETSDICTPDRRLVERELKELLGKLQRSCSRRQECASPSGSPSASTTLEEEAKTMAVMAAIINAFPYMYRGLDDSQGRKKICQRFQAVKEVESQEIRRLAGDLESLLLAAQRVLTLATSAWAELQNVDDISIQESTLRAQGSSAGSRDEATPGVTGQPKGNQPQASNPGEIPGTAGGEHAASRGHNPSLTEPETADTQQPENQTKATEAQAEAERQQRSMAGKGTDSSKHSEFLPPSEPEHQIFFHLCMIGFATLLESGSQCTALLRFREHLARAPGVTEMREEMRNSGARAMMHRWMGSVTLDALSPEDERLKECPELFTEISRFGRNILVEGLRQLSYMRGADVPSLDDVVERTHAAKEAMARQAAQTQEPEVAAGSSSETQEAADSVEKHSATSQDLAKESSHRPQEEGVEGATEDQAAGSDEKDMTPQGGSSSVKFLESTMKIYKGMLDVMKQPEVLQSLPQVMSLFQPRATKPSQPQPPIDTQPSTPASSPSTPNPPTTTSATIPPPHPQQ